MVCLGNICRSPLAEGILQSMTDPDKVLVDSAGTGGYHLGNRPDGRSIAVARKYGIDISAQRCRQFETADFDNFDLIYAMDHSNLDHLASLATSRKDREKLRLLLEEVPGLPSEVPDPYYGGEKGFERVFQLISSACEAISRNLDQKSRIHER